jgi:hypothetical protein
MWFSYRAIVLQALRGIFYAPAKMGSAWKRRSPKQRICLWARPAISDDRTGCIDCVQLEETRRGNQSEAFGQVHMGKFRGRVGDMSRAHIKVGARSWSWSGRPVVCGKIKIRFTRASIRVLQHQPPGNASAFCLRSTTSQTMTRYGPGPISNPASMVGGSRYSQDLPWWHSPSRPGWPRVDLISAYNLSQHLHKCDILRRSILRFLISRFKTSMSTWRSSAWNLVLGPSYSRVGLG